MADTQNEIPSKVREALKGSPYMPSTLRPLVGGTANFIYHATLDDASPECAAGVVVKQGEAYVASRPAFQLATSRCTIEQQCLVYLAALPPTTSSTFTISTPRMLLFNPATNTQVQEYLPHAVNLKEYALAHYATPAAAASVKPQCVKLGRSLGHWLRSFHDWSERPDQARLREILARNKDMQGLKHMINYRQLVQLTGAHPDILGDEVKPVLQEIAEMAAGELADEAALHVIHGDFWTGNVLIPDEPIPDDKQTSIKIIDWELAQLGVRPLDVGQMIAELWQLKLYRDMDAGEWLIRAFVDGYGSVTAEFAFRTIVHVGVHLICFGARTPGWGTAAQGEELVRTGKEIILKAWGKNRDRAGFQGHVLECLFGDTTEDCYVQYVALKMSKRLNAMHRDTRVSRDLTPRRYLAGLSFGPSSSVMAQILDDTARHHSLKRSSSAFEPRIVHVDTDLSYPAAHPDSPALKLLARYRERFPHVVFECVHLSEILNVPSIDWSTLPLPEESGEPLERLRRLFEQLPNATSRADILRLFVRHLLLHVAMEKSYDALLLGHSTTALAALTLSEVANGRGFAIPWQVNDGMSTVCKYERVSDPTGPSAYREKSKTEFPIYYPMREVFRNEILQYIKLEPSLEDLVTPESTTSSVVSHKDLSIEEVMARYFQGVEDSYSGIVSNVVRTTGKLERVAGNGFCGSCGMTLDEQGDTRWAGDLGDDSGGYSGATGTGQLCYGCKRSIHG
ncbi:hypothetical protein G7046_g8543 [Stylonectria norvegica]|nr:hypothetical protein G7046_g8543 [Stylonectria norvegica]